MHSRDNADGSRSWRVRWRENGRQKTATFLSAESGERFRLNIERYGPEQAMLIEGVGAVGEKTYSLRQAIDDHLASLTGIERGTIVTYERYRDRDLADMGALPLEAITDTIVAAWLADLAEEFSGKTVANKHGFLSAVMGRAVREGKIPTNPCDRTRLPRKDSEREPVFLTKAQFAAILKNVPDGWKPLVRWLVGTGMRFGEATALRVGDVDPDEGLVRIRRAWKFTGTAEPKMSYPKSKAGRRDINVPASLIAELDLSRPAEDLLFLDPDRGGRVTYPKFRHTAWKNAVKAAGVNAKPHDLRHTCASWMLKAGVPIHVVQVHLGHESITTTVGVYGHTDRASHRQAADAVSAMLD